MARAVAGTHRDEQEVEPPNTSSAGGQASARPGRAGRCGRPATARSPAPRRAHARRDPARSARCGHQPDPGPPQVQGLRDGGAVTGSPVRRGNSGRNRLTWLRSPRPHGGRTPPSPVRRPTTASSSTPTPPCPDPDTGDPSGPYSCSISRRSAPAGRQRPRPATRPPSRCGRPTASPKGWRRWRGAAVAAGRRREDLTLVLPTSSPAGSRSSCGHRPRAARPAASASPSGHQPPTHGAGPGLTRGDRLVAVITKPLAVALAPTDHGEAGRQRPRGGASSAHSTMQKTGPPQRAAQARSTGHHGSSAQGTGATRPARSGDIRVWSTAGIAVCGPEPGAGQPARSW